MKASKTYINNYHALRIGILEEISRLVQAHRDIEMAVEFQKPIFYGSGVDEQDNSPEIEEITNLGVAIIYYQGDEIERVRLETMGTDKLLEVLEGLEESLADLTK